MKSNAIDHFIEGRRGAGCEFCLEFGEHQASRFGRAYAGVSESRIIERHGGMVVLPTIGQLFAGSLLIMPLSHFETTAEMPERELSACLSLLSVFSERVRSFGEPVVFEHGARAGTGRSCGIYHAHVHLVPVPSDISIDNALPRAGADVATLEAAYEALGAEDTYLLFRDTYGGVRYVAGEAARSQEYGSQYFRKVLASYFQLSSPWDWRDSKGVEPRLIETLATLQPHVAVC